jgi:hypothetical protein
VQNIYLFEQSAGRKRASDHRGDAGEEYIEKLGATL